MDEPIKQNEPTENRSQGYRTLDARLVQIDFNHFIEVIKSEDAWKEKDRNAITVFKNDIQTMVLIALHENALMAEHTANGFISVRPLEGEIEFKTQTENAVLTPGKMITLNKGIPHSVLAKKESVFLLTITSVPATYPGLLVCD